MTEADWQQWLGKFLAEFRQPVPLVPNEADLVLGESWLSEDGAFVCAWLDFVAEATGSFPKFRDFLRRFREALTVPRRPLVEPPSPKRARSRAAFLKESATYHVAFERYRQERSRYEGRQRRLDAFANRYPANEEGYVRFIDDQTGGALGTFLACPQRLPIPDFSVQRHTLVVGASGSGKSELLKLIAHAHLTQNPDAALILIDPHGDFALDVARLNCVSPDQLVFIDLAASEEHSACLNPFEVGEGFSDRELDIAQQELLAQFGAVLGERAALSATMEAVLSPCIASLVRMPGATVADLRNFFDPERNERLLSFAENNLSNPSQIDFLQRDFANTRNDTRQAITNKLQVLLGSDVFRRFLVGRSTLDLEREIEARKLIIFTLSVAGGGDAVAPAIGRLIMAKIMGIASKRALLSPEERQACAPIYCLIDEAQNFGTPSMKKVLDECRKFRLHLTLACQFLGQFTEPEVRDSVSANTAVKIIGRQGDERGCATSAKLAGTTPERVADLGVGEFFVRVGAFPGYTLHVDQHLIGGQQSIPDHEWEAILAEQLDRNYRPISGSRALDSESETEATESDGELTESASPFELN